jgi:hypothetical protein
VVLGRTGAEEELEPVFAVVSAVAICARQRWSVKEVDAVETVAQ